MWLNSSAAALLTASNVSNSSAYLPQQQRLVTICTNALLILSDVSSSLAVIWTLVIIVQSRDGGGWRNVPASWYIWMSALAIDLRLSSISKCPKQWLLCLVAAVSIHLQLSRVYWCLKWRRLVFCAWQTWSHFVCLANRTLLPPILQRDMRDVVTGLSR